MIEIKMAHPNDLEKIVDLMADYVHEAGMDNLTFDRTHTTETVQFWLENGGFFLAMDSQEIVGFSVIIISHTLYAETVANNDVFYVKPSYRGKGIGRMLTKKMVEFSEENSAKAIYSACLSNTDEKNHALYGNMLKKYGFKILGSCFIRS